MKVAIADRPETERAMPADLVKTEDDYVYAEYLDGACVADSPAFIQSRFGCPRDIMDLVPARHGGSG